MEYVWVLHEFKPQEADELPLKAGDRVAVIEKDDVYQDGWWKGTNPDGKTGLFPRSYTTDKPPATQTPSTADRSGVAFPNSGAAPTTPTKVAEESTPTNGSHTNGSKEERTRNFSHGEITMQATITDVQRAIEQLGGDDNDGNRSFSFRSLNDEYSERSDTGTDGETSDVDDGTDFHRNAREKLALRAKVENEQRMKESGSVPSTPLRITQPPIDVELSDESDDEGDDLKVLDALKNQRRHSEGAPDSKFATRYSYIPEEDEAEVAEASRLPSGRPSLDDRNATLGSSLPSARPTIPTFSHSIPSPDSDNGYIVPSEDYIVPSPGVDQDDLPTATADRLTFNVPLVASPEPSPSLSAQTQSTEPSPIPPPAPPPVSVVMPPPAAPAPLPIAAPAPLPAALASPMSFRTTTPVATPPASVTSFSHRRVASSSSAAFSMRSASLSASPAPTTVVDTVMPGTLNPLTPPTPENESTPVLPAASAPSILSLGTAVSSAPSTVKLAPIPIRTNEALPPAVRSGAPSPGLPLPSPSVSSSGSFATSSASKHQSLTPATTPMSFKGPAYSTPSHETSPLSTQEGGKKSPTTHPSEWALEEVVDWLMSKGFDQAVCERFMEQEITGDVLLELNPNILKDEIGILKWGQRQRIMNAITELRRPRSFVEYERPPMANIATSRTQSLNYGHSHTSSIQSSAQQSYNNSPLGYAGPGFSPPPAAAQTMPMASTNVAPGSYGSFSSADASIYQMSFPEPPMSAASMPMPQSGWRPFEAVGVPPQSEVTLNNGRVFEPVPEGVRMPVGAAPLVGLGLNAPPSPSSSRPQSPGASPSSTKPSKSRPSNLTVSASDQHLNVTAIGEEDQAAASGDEDRGAMSEPDGQDHKSKRRRLFGRSAESASIKEKATSLKEIKESGSSRHSKESSRVTLNDGSSKLSAGDEAAPVRRHSKKKSGDDRGKGDRLSLFGGSIGGAIAKKARKPVPRLSSGGLNERSEKDKEKEKEKERKEKEKKEKEKEKEKVVKTLHGDKPEKAEKGEKAEKSEHDWTSLATFTRMRHHSERRASGRPSTADGAFKREKIGQSLSPKDRPKDPALLRKRTSSMSDSVSSPPPSGVVKPGKSILQQIGTPDHNGWMRKKSDHYNSWKLRYFVLKGSHLYCLKSNDKSETKIKGYINIVGYKVIADENIDPGRYGFRIVHESDKTHYFSHDEQIVIREWMKALMKATITRDFANPVASSSNIPTIPLAVAQAMNPSPRPPSPSARAATQRAHRRDNPNQLSSRDAQILLMAMPQKSPSLSSPSLNGSFQDGERARVESFFTSNSVPNKMAEPASPRRPITPKAPVPPRPSREMRRKVTSPSPEDNAVLDDSLIDWANSHLPEGLQITDPTGSLGGGLTLLRIAENIKGTPSSPPVADSAFPSGPNDDKLDGLFALFDFLLENDVKMGAVSINDIRQGKKQKVVQILQALRTWEQKRNSISTSIAQGSLAGAGYMSGPLQFF